MSAPSATRVLRGVNIRQASRWMSQSRSAGQLCRSRAVLVSKTSNQSNKHFSTSRYRYAGLMPDTHDPQPPQRVEEARSALEATEIPDEEYHALADEYMDTIHEEAEQLQEARDDVEVEYSAGVLSISYPPVGTYIINKQPPNKQIWLSSPKSGPKRYDWVLAGEGFHQKEGGGSGEWVYLRDGSTMQDLLQKELGLTIDIQGHEERMRQQSVDPTE